MVHRDHRWQLVGREHLRHHHHAVAHGNIRQATPEVLPEAEVVLTTHRALDVIGIVGGNKAQWLAEHVDKADALARPGEVTHDLVRVEVQIIAVEGHLKVGTPLGCDRGGANDAHLYR
eukprot:scaffold117038_cov63-Phaeocystis_antarctica.AAC.1